MRLVETGKNEATDSLTLWLADHKTDPAAIGGSFIQLNLSQSNIVTIPAAGDKLDLAGAALMSGLKIEPAPCPEVNSQLRRWRKFM